MYNSYAEYINNREKDLNKLAETIPEISQILPLIGEGIKISAKYADAYDKVKEALEKQIGHKMEYAEVDIYLQSISGLLLDSSMISFNPEEIAGKILDKLDSIFPGSGIADNGLKVEVSRFTKKLVNNIINKF